MGQPADSKYDSLNVGNEGEATETSTPTEAPAAEHTEAPAEPAPEAPAPAE